MDWASFFKMVLAIIVGGGVLAAVIPSLYQH
jgi:hypothetical protein